MFEKKTKLAGVEPPLYKVVQIGSTVPQTDLNQAAEGGYRFLEWLDDKWERNGYSENAGTRKAIYVKA